MIVVGLTGGIGSGKSTVGQIWEKLGAKVVRADDLAKELMTTDSQLINKIKQVLGEESYTVDGKLNKSYLAKEAFEKGRVNELNALVHPAVYTWFEQQKEIESQKGTELLVREAALLLDKGRPDGFDKIVLVKASIDKRIQRVMQRDSISQDEVYSRIQKQISTEQMISLADIIIENDGDLSMLEQKATHVFNQLREWAHK